MNLIECRAIIKKLQSENLPENYPLIAFYQRKEQELLIRINSGLNAIFKDSAPHVL